MVNMLHSSFQPMPPYFLVRIPLKEQQERLEKIGNIYLHPSYIYMTRGMQCGEIVAIGEDAGSYFPEAKVGNILMFSHMIEGKRDDKRQRFYFIHEDEHYNYYAVSGIAGNGERNMSYAVWDGNKIIPCQDYIFLEVEKLEDTGEKVEFNVKGKGLFKPDRGFTVSAGGVLVMSERKKTREEIREIMKNNMNRMRYLSNFIQNKDAVIEIERLQIENSKYSTEINTRRYEPKIVHAVNNDFNEGVERSFGSKIIPGETIFMLNIACDYKIEFNKKEYIVAETQYFASTEKWLKDSIANYKELSKSVIVP